jgi:hypothetical protein
MTEISNCRRTNQKQQSYFFEPTSLLKPPPSPRVFPAVWPNGVTINWKILKVCKTWRDTFALRAQVNIDHKAAEIRHHILSGLRHSPMPFAEHALD